MGAQLTLRLGLYNADMSISILSHKSFSCLSSFVLFSSMDVHVPLLIPLASTRSPRNFVFTDFFLGGAMEGVVVVVVMR